MIKEAVDIKGKDDNTERVLVCITSQANSERLIDMAAEMADMLNGELHILHVQRGGSIFNNSDTPRLINELCQYGGKKGGSIHFYCDEDIAECIGKFVFEKHITRIVIGQPPKCDINDTEGLKNAANKVLRCVKGNVEVIVVPRSQTEKCAHICLKTDFN